MIEEQDDSDDDDDTLVEPLRQTDAQAVVSPTLLTRPAMMERDEARMVLNTLWAPSLVENRHKRRRIEEIQHAQSWRAVLSEKFQHIGAKPPAQVRPQCAPACAALPADQTTDA